MPNDSQGRPAPDRVLTDIADYVLDHRIESAAAYRAARHCLIDSMGCAVAALDFPECTKRLGPMVPGMAFPDGVPVPGTGMRLDPISAAFSIGTMIRWLDFNDAFIGHPSDNLGAILPAADYISRRRPGGQPLLMRDVLTALIKAYEIQGVLLLDNDYPSLGYDYDPVPKVAAGAVVTQIMGGGRDEIINAISNAWADGVCVRIYRQGNNTGPRKSWAAGDSASRAVRLVMMALNGEMGYPSVLTAKTHGFYDALFRGNPFKFPRPYGHHMVEHVTFKFVPAGHHGQSAAECAFRLHPLVKDRIEEIDSIVIRTQKALLRIMDKRGPLANPADRDHCAQYVVAVGLLHGRIEASYFEDAFAADPRIDRLRDRMTVVEDPDYTRGQLDPEKRSRANAIEVRLKDGTVHKAEVEYPLGHPRRRAESLPMLEEKFAAHLARRYSPAQRNAILALCSDQARLESTPVHEFMEAYAL
jgi:2-methylcitrate dehydratase